jgi:hypothetical protein
MDAWIQGSKGKVKGTPENRANYSDRCRLGQGGSNGSLDD